MTAVSTVAIIGAVVLVVAVNVWAVFRRRGPSSHSRSSDDTIARPVVTQRVEGGTFVVAVERVPDKHRVMWTIQQPPAADTGLEVTVGTDRSAVTIPANTPLAQVPGLINAVAGHRFSATLQLDAHGTATGICFTSGRAGSAGRLAVTGIEAATLTDQNGDHLDARVLVNGDPVATTNDFVRLRGDVSAQIMAVGTTSIVVGPEADAGRLWFGLGLRRSASPAGALLLYRTLRLQLAAGVVLVGVGGVGGMYYGTTQGTLKGQTRALEAQAGVTTTSTSIKGSTTTTPSTTTTSIPESPGQATAVPTTAATTGTITAQNPPTPGGTTSSTVSLVQAIALAMVAAGATMIPTGAVGVLAARVKDE